MDLILDLTIELILDLAGDLGDENLLNLIYSQIYM